ncbi:hypothetical [Yersinia pestis KIM10+]|uniref:Uncharacterized protein n=1 Tax=Yersinia pestis TaxID=632 RepID=Q8CKW4_YERPE|nr:hypothetical [Yersinia pestis KIM10+]
MHWQRAGFIGREPIKALLNYHLLQTQPHQWLSLQGPYRQDQYTTIYLMN